MSEMDIFSIFMILHVSSLFSTFHLIMLWWMIILSQKHQAAPQPRDWISVHLLFAIAPCSGRPLVSLHGIAQTTVLTQNRHAACRKPYQDRAKLIDVDSDLGKLQYLYCKRNLN